LPQLVAGLTLTIIFLAVLSIVLTAAGPDGLGLTEGRTSTWIAAVYGLPMLPSLFLSLRHRQPLMLTGNVFALTLFRSLGIASGSPSSPAPRWWPARRSWSRRCSA
jgi:predicted benzoate:H+ symporter BenE